jgi:hypothetical protein
MGIYKPPGLAKRRLWLWNSSFIWRQTSEQTKVGAFEGRILSNVRAGSFNARREKTQKECKDAAFDERR